MMISELEKDLLVEIINVGVGKAAASLSEMLNTKIYLDVPSINLLPYNELLDQYNQNIDSNTKVLLQFRGTMTGTSEMVISGENANKIVLQTMGVDESHEDYENVKKEVLNEVGNIILNNVVGHISNCMDSSVDYTVPNYIESSKFFIEENKELKGETIVLFCKTHMVINQLSMESRINILLIENSFEALGNFLRKEIKKYL